MKLKATLFSLVLFMGAFLQAPTLKVADKPVLM